MAKYIRSSKDERTRRGVKSKEVFHFISILSKTLIDVLTTYLAVAQIVSQTLLLCALGESRVDNINN